MDELVKRLRNRRICIQQLGTLNDYPLLGEAADAIEELLAERDEVNADSWKRAFEVERDEHRWIPVTEQLPEKTGEYLVCGQWRGKSAETWVCELITFGTIKGWANDARNPAVTHWMPLPQPPEEGET